MKKIGNRALREFISRNYRPDTRGRWYFQNGPQRVFVALAYTPLVLHEEDGALFDHCGRRFRCEQMFLDDEGSLLMHGANGIGLLDDRDLMRFAGRARGLPVIARHAVAHRLGFVANPTSETGPPS